MRIANHGAKIVRKYAQRKILVLKIPNSTQIVGQVAINDYFCAKNTKL